MLILIAQQIQEKILKIDKIQHPCNLKRKKKLSKLRIQGDFFTSTKNFSHTSFLMIKC